MKISQIKPIIELISKGLCVWCEKRMNINYKPTIPLCTKCRIKYLEGYIASFKVKNERN